MQMTEKVDTKNNSNLQTQFFDNGEFITSVTANLANQMSKLPSAIYTVMRDEESGQYKFRKDERRFELPPVIFGKSMKAHSDIVCRQYRNNRKPSLGLMSLGEKGCGKTEQNNIICNSIMDEHDIPTLRIDKAIPKGPLLSIIKGVGRCIVYLDEYEKTYSPTRRDETQAQDGTKVNEDELITLFSDKTLDNVLFVISANRVHDISPFLLNRPTRFLFRFNYSGTDDDVVEEVCKHFKLKDDVSAYLREYVEDTKCSTDVTINIAEQVQDCENADQLQEIFEIINAPKPKRYLWRVYTKSGTAEGITVKAVRKKLIITHEESKRKWEIDYGNFYMKFQYNSNFRCYVISGLAGASSEASIGFMPAGWTGQNDKEDEDVESVTYFQLEDQNQKRPGL